jgi:hypothetical protein
VEHDKLVLPRRTPRTVLVDSTGMHEWSLERRSGIFSERGPVGHGWKLGSEGARQSSAKYLQEYEHGSGRMLESAEHAEHAEHLLVSGHHYVVLVCSFSSSWRQVDQVGSPSCSRSQVWVLPSSVSSCSLFDDCPEAKVIMSSKAVHRKGAIVAALDDICRV